jgi:ribonuclease HII
MLELPEQGRVEIAIDEAGRGCLAFEVCAAAVVMPQTLPVDDQALKMLAMIKDSKKVTAPRRQKLSEFIKCYAIAYGIGTASPQEIDKFNILNATYMAMHRAIDIVIEKLGGNADIIVVDGDKFKPYVPPLEYSMNLDGAWMMHTCIPGGDNIKMNIAAASILAKTHRDNIVSKYVERMPEFKEKYGFDTNKAYGTKKHMDGLKQYGLTEFHRKSFAPVRDCIST